MEESSKKSTNAKSVTEPRPSNLSNEPPLVAEIAHLNLALDETGSFRICTSPNCAKQTASVLRRLNEREQELWCRRFTPSCIENIINNQTVDEETKTFYREIERRLKNQ